LLPGHADREAGEKHAEITWQQLKAGWLKARIAYHRRQADSYSKPVVRSFRRDAYEIWMRNMAMRHAMKAHDLERRLLVPGGQRA
jgi:hypothetical protein